MFKTIKENNKFIQKKTECGMPPLLENGYSNHSDNVVVENEAVQYSCKSGYTMNEDSTSIFACKNGTFTPLIGKSGMKCTKGK